MASTARLQPPEECAQCGAEIPRNARACRDCGADERTGWREVSAYDGLDLPDDTDESSASLGHYPRSRSGAGLRWYWMVVLCVVLMALILGALGL